MHHEEKEGLKENKRNARAFLKNMHITDMRVFAESMDRDTTGLTTSQVKALLMQMAHDFDWMPDPPTLTLLGKNMEVTPMPQPAAPLSAQQQKLEGV